MTSVYSFSFNEIIQVKFGDAKNFDVLNMLDVRGLSLLDCGGN